MYKDLTLHDIAKKLCEKADTWIIFHRKPDPDCVGSAVALAGVLEKLGNKVCLVGSDRIPERLAFINAPEPYRVLSAEDVKTEKLPGRIISVDVASKAQTGGIFEILESRGARVDLMIDHHEKGGRFADGYVDPDAAATGEILFDLFEMMGSVGPAKEGKWPLQSAKAVYAAIAGDTGGFRFSNTTGRTHERIAELMTYPLGHDEICRKIFASKTRGQLRAEAEALSHFEFLMGGQATYYYMSLAVKHKLNLLDEDLGTMIDVIREIENVRVAIIVREEDGGKYRVSMRSTDTVNVADICATFSGGGHARAGGFTVGAESPEKLKADILALVRAQMGET